MSRNRLAEARISAWERPLKAQVADGGRYVEAIFRATDPNRPPAASGVLEAFLRIASGSTRSRPDRAIESFVLRYGLLGSPWGRWIPGQVGEAGFVRREPTSDYVDLSRVLASAVETQRRLRSGARLDQSDVERLMAATLDRSGLAEVIPIVRRVSRRDAAVLWRRTSEPLPSEFRGDHGNLRKGWREMQAERLVQLFNVWVRDGGVRPKLIRDGTHVHAAQWSGGTWAALAAEFQDVLTGQKRMGSCGYCGRHFEGTVRQPRTRYAGKKVRQCCGDLECRRARQREYTSRSRRHRR